MNFYEVLADGYHSPLTKTQISELFQAGRLGRHHPCKQVATKEWRTIDELFPLLKYQSSSPWGDDADDPGTHSAKARLLMLLLFLAAITAGAIVWYSFQRNARVDVRRADSVAHNWPKTIPSATTTSPAFQESFATSADAPRAIVGSQQARLAQESPNAEKLQREQARAAQDRLRAERADLERKAAGRDEIIPLGKFTVIHNVGGMDVNVKVVDNDVTSFDVCINGRWQHEVPKQKGITGSRTDETLIHSNGRACLYYVWEISGTLNHCRLRVRDD
jgi:hypothetical protein